MGVSDGSLGAFRLLLIRVVRLHIQHTTIIMKFTDILTKIEAMITHGSPASDIKGYIATVYDQADALQNQYPDPASVVKDSVDDPSSPPCSTAAWQILQRLFDRRHVAISQLCGATGLSTGEVEYHLSVLSKYNRAFFHPGSVDSEDTACILPEGTAFVVKYRERN